MKFLKSILFISVLCASSLFSYGQITSFGIGIRGGANFSIPSEMDNVEYKTGYYVGLYKHIKLIPLLSLNPEVEYTKQGYKTLTDDITLSYVAVPVMARLKLLMFSIETGPQFNFKVDENFTSSVADKASPEFNSYETNWAFGLSFHFPVIGLAINSRYITSFDNIAKDMSGKNQVVQVGLAFQI